MKTDQLIDMLAKNVEPAERPKMMGRLLITLGVGLVVGLVLVALSVKFRPDLGEAHMPVMMKAMFSAAAAAMFLPLSMRLMKPGRPLGWRIAAILVFVGICALATIVALMGEMPERRIQMWLGGGFPWCIVAIPLFAAPTAALLIWLMRAFAPTRLTMTGAAIGGVAGGIGAMAYAMYCPVDSVAFVTTWYVVAIAICAALGAVIGARLLRW